MPKSIHERVRAQIERREREAAKAEGGVTERQLARAVARENLREAAIESLAEDYGDFVQLSEKMIRGRESELIVEDWLRATGADLRRAKK